MGRGGERRGGERRGRGEERRERRGGGEERRGRGEGGERRRMCGMTSTCDRKGEPIARGKGDCYVIVMTRY